MEINDILGMRKNGASKADERQHICELVAVKYLKSSSLFSEVIVMQKYRCIDCNRYFVRRQIKYFCSVKESSDWLRVEPASKRYLFKGNRYIKAITQGVKSTSVSTI